LLPAAPAAGTAGAIASGHAGGRRTSLTLKLRVPRARRGKAGDARHSSTISPQTQSVAIKMNGGTAQVFNTTPASPNCSVSGGGTSCAFTVDAPVGNVTMLVSTYSQTSAGGTLLDQGSALVTIVAGKANAPVISLGPVVSTTADSGPGSLRYAVGSANSGDTILFVVPSGSTIVLSEPISISDRLSIAGPGTTPGVTLSGNNATQIFVVKNTATAAISGLTLAQGAAAVAQQPGGAIWNAGTLTLTDDTFTGDASIVQSPLLSRAHTDARQPAGRMPHHLHPHCSNTYHDGGAVYNDGTLAISASTFEGNAETSDPANCVYGRGGALFNDQNGALSVDGTTFAENGAFRGGAVYNDGASGQAAFTNDTFDGNYGCVAGNGCATAEGYGAAIYDAPGPGITIANSVFKQNVEGGTSPGSFGDGAALDLESTAPSITGSTFTANVAGGATSGCSNGDGGAILAENGTLELDDDTFTSNLAGGDFAGYGGAIYTDDPLNGTGDTFTSNQALGSGSACTASGDAYGGAIYDSLGAPVTLTNTSFGGNSAVASSEAWGGAIINESTVKLAGDTFSSNAATGTVYTGASPQAAGGAIYNQTTGALVLSTDTFSNNTATADGSAAVQAYGGAIASMSTVSSLHDAFTGNSVSAPNGASAQNEGGAIFSEGVIQLDGDTFTQNAVNAPFKAFGGALFSDASGSTVAGTSFNSNTASSAANGGAGGAIYDVGSLTITSSTLTGNAASQAGGGLYADATDYVYTSSFSGNHVTAAGQTDGGGGIYAGQAMLVSNSTIAGNTVAATAAQAGGGGIYNYGGLLMESSTVSGNAVTGAIAGSGGGGIFNNDSATIANTTISGNSSSVDGGGFETYDPPLAFTVQLTTIRSIKTRQPGRAATSTIPTRCRCRSASSPEARRHRGPTSPMPER